MPDGLLKKKNNIKMKRKANIKRQGEYIGLLEMEIKSFIIIAMKIDW